MRRVLLASLALVLLVAAPRAAEVQLVLRDGRVLTGTDVTREEGNYLLVLEGGDVVPIPEQLVERVVLAASAPPAEEPSPETGAPTGMRSPPPAQLAGTPVEPPQPPEQLAALGPPSRFQQGVINPHWHPESDWQADPGDPRRNDFAPSKWAESVVDTEWHPQSAFNEDHTQFAPSSFQPDIVDSTWVPQDGFAKRSL